MSERMRAGHWDRISTMEVMMRFAELVALRSTCRRARVGAVVTDPKMLQVLGYGYNGNAKGLPNTCDSTLPGYCGCVHAELNALLKAPGSMPKWLFTSVAPCDRCAKAIINANVQRLFFRRPYRETTGLAFLLAANVDIIQLDESTGALIWISAPSQLALLAQQANDAIEEATLP